MAATIKEALGIECELIKSSGGIFDIKADAKLIYSKHQSNDQFPDEGQIVETLQGLQD